MTPAAPPRPEKMNHRGTEDTEKTEDREERKKKPRLSRFHPRSCGRHSLFLSLSSVFSVSSVPLWFNHAFARAARRRGRPGVLRGRVGGAPLRRRGPPR